MVRYLCFLEKQRKKLEVQSHTTILMPQDDIAIFLTSSYAFYYYQSHSEIKHTFSCEKNQAYLGEEEHYLYKIRFFFFCILQEPIKDCYLFFQPQ